MGSNILLSKTAKFITRVIGLAFAYGITSNIEDAYAFLVEGKFCTYSRKKRLYLGHLLPRHEE